MTSEMDEGVAVVILPDCLIIDIFSRLPVKSLCRFKCVSRFCLSFIQHPSFIDQIRPKTPTLWQIQHDSGLDVFSIDCNGVSTLIHSHEFRYDFGYDFSFFKGFCYYNGRYCNGLNCFIFNDVVGLCVCNVTTKECILLPKWCNYYVLCFDSSSKKFKILGWVDKNGHHEFCVLILERDPSWRPIMNPLNIDCMQEPDAIIGGEPFWVRGEERQIISFNPTNEEFRVIGLPDELSEETFRYPIFEFEGSLSFVEQHRREEPIFSLWILNDNGWVTMKKNIAMPFEDTNMHEHYSRPGVQRWRADGCNFLSRGGELLVAVVGDFDYQFMFIYNFLNNQFKKIKITGLPFCDFTMRNYMDSGMRMRYYVENNVCLQELVGTEVVRRGDSSALEPVNM